MISILCSVEWKSALPPTNFHTDSITVNTTSAEVSAVVEWTANPHSMNCYYSLYWMSTTTGDNGFRKLHVSCGMNAHISLDRAPSTCIWCCHFSNQPCFIWGQPYQMHYKWDETWSVMLFRRHSRYLCQSTVTAAYASQCQYHLGFVSFVSMFRWHIL